jgi:hypothetical protein
MEDWDLSPVLSGAQPFNLQWLLETTAEHRYVLGKVLLYPVWLISGKDFRAPMCAVLLIVPSYACMHLARTLRARASFSDAFFRSPPGIAALPHTFRKILGTTFEVFCTTFGPAGVKFWPWFAIGIAAICGSSRNVLGLWQD